MTIASNLGFPRIGRRRELKTALEQFWAGDTGRSRACGPPARAARRPLAPAGRARASATSRPAISRSTTMCWTPPACWARSRRATAGTSGPVSLATYFALARGSRGAAERPRHRARLPALEMTKWFDTNYHYLVPRLSAEQRFALTANRPLALFREAPALAIRTRPVLLGPGQLPAAVEDRRTGPTRSTCSTAAAGLRADPARAGRRRLRPGCRWMSRAGARSAEKAPGSRLRSRLRHAAPTVPTPDVLLTSYFGPLGDNLATAAGLPVAGLHLDLVRGARTAGRRAGSAAARNGGCRLGSSTGATSGAPICGRRWRRCDESRRCAARAG